MGPVSIGVEVQRNTDGDTISSLNLCKLFMAVPSMDKFLALFCIYISNDFLRFGGGPV